MVQAAEDALYFVIYNIGYYSESKDVIERMTCYYDYNDELTDIEDDDGEDVEDDESDDD